MKFLVYNFLHQEERIEIECEEEDCPACEAVSKSDVPVGGEVFLVVENWRNQGETVIRRVRVMQRDEFTVLDCVTVQDHEAKAS